MKQLTAPKMKRNTRGYRASQTSAYKNTYSTDDKKEKKKENVEKERNPANDNSTAPNLRAKESKSKLTRVSGLFHLTRYGGSVLANEDQKKPTNDEA